MYFLCQLFHWSLPILPDFVFALSHVMIACSLPKESAPVVSKKNFAIKRSVLSGLGYVGLLLAEAFSRHMKDDSGTGETRRPLMS